MCLIGLILHYVCLPIICCMNYGICYKMECHFDLYV